MPLLAIRINSIVGAPDPAFDGEGNPVDGDDWDFNDAEEEIVYVDSEDMLDVDNAISDVKHILFGWRQNVQDESQATTT